MGAECQGLVSDGCKHTAGQLPGHHEPSSRASSSCCRSAPKRCRMRQCRSDFAAFACDCQKAWKRGWGGGGVCVSGRARGQGVGGGGQSAVAMPNKWHVHNQAAHLHRKQYGGQRKSHAATNAEASSTAQHNTAHVLSCVFSARHPLHSALASNSRDASSTWASAAGSVVVNCMVSPCSCCPWCAPPFGWSTLLCCSAAGARATAISRPRGSRPCPACALEAGLVASWKAESSREDTGLSAAVEHWSVYCGRP